MCVWTCTNSIYSRVVCGLPVFVLTEQRVLRAVRGLPDDAACVVRAGLRGERDTRHHQAGHELQLPAARR